jgi:hypothetical protein
MPEKKMLIVDSDVARKIEENRGDMSVSHFIDFLIDSQLKQDVVIQGNGGHVTKEEFYQFEHGIRELLRNFLEFFLSYGLELGKQPADSELDKLNQKLRVLHISESKSS